jgi:hypothetical protein
MKCPVCKTNDLIMSDRQGVEIDYCPECRGVWLDRGELDKIIERSLPSTAAGSERSYRDADRSSSHDKKHGHGHDDHHDSKHGYGKSYKKKSLLKDIFDF